MIVETTKMSERGQLIIPKQIREAAGATKDTTFACTVLDDGTILMKKMDYSKIFRKIRASTIKVSDNIINNEIHEIRKSRNRH